MEYSTAPASVGTELIRNSTPNNAIAAPPAARDGMPENASAHTTAVTVQPTEVADFAQVGLRWWSTTITCAELVPAAL